MASTRFSSSLSRSSMAGDRPFAVASRISRSLAARIVWRRARNAAAAAFNARFFCSLDATLKASAAARAALPMAPMISGTVS